MRPARRITQKNNSIGGICRRTYCNPKQIGGILIAKLIVAEKPSVAMSYAKVLGATNHQDGYLEGNGYLVSWCVGHLVELAPPNVYDDKYVKWGALQTCPSYRRSGSIWCLPVPKSSLASCKN